MPLPALAIPIITALGQGLQGYLQNSAANKQQQQQQDALAVQKQRLQYERAQQLRDNAMQDAQGHALNPVRSNLYASLAQRLGLPANTFAFNTAPSAAAAPRSATPGMPQAGQFDRQASAESVYQTTMAQAERLMQNFATREVGQRLKQHAVQQYQAAMGGQ